MKIISFFNIIAIPLFLLSLLSAEARALDMQFEDRMLENPSEYIEIHKWGFYNPFSVGVLHNITIENTSAVTYSDVEIKLSYFTPHNAENSTRLSYEKKTLDLILPAGTSKTYFTEGGVTVGTGYDRITRQKVEAVSVKQAEVHMDFNIYAE